MRHRKKTIWFTIMTLIAMLMLSTVCLAGGEEETTTSTDKDYNGSAEDGDKTGGSADQYAPDELGLGFSVNATGYRFYIAQCYTPGMAYGTEEQHDQFGDAKIITLAPVDVYMSEPPKASDGYQITQYRTLKEEYKTGTSDFIHADKVSASVKGKFRAIKSVTADEIATAGMSGLPAPITSDGKNFYANGIAFKEWMLTSNGTEGGNNGTALIKYFWGEEMLTEFLEHDDYYLIVEPIMWSSKYKFVDFGYKSSWTTETSNDGKQVIFLGTAQEWAYYMATEGDPKGLGLSTDDTGKGCYINIIYSSALPKCMLLERVNSRFSTVYPEANRLSANHRILLQLHLCVAG